MNTFVARTINQASIRTDPDHGAGCIPYLPVSGFYDGQAAALYRIADPSQDHGPGTLVGVHVRKGGHIDETPPYSTVTKVSPVIGRSVYRARIYGAR